LQKGKTELGLSSTTDKQKEAVWRVEFEALGEQLVLKNVKQAAIQNEVKCQAASRWLSEQAQLRDRREARSELAWLALFVAMAAVLIGIIGLLAALN
jgi:post-segregation antitoxin (ccd killing protein)